MSGAMPERLRLDTLAHLPPSVATRRYARDRLSAGIVHIGLGHYTRAHQALYLDDLFARGEGHEWAICGVGLLPSDARMAEALAPQDHLYTLVERDRAGESVRVVGSLVEDAWPVMGETFRQWVIEDRFVDGRPAYEAAGAQMTADVHPYELMKIHLLNAGHQAFCHLGVVLGDAASRIPKFVLPMAAEPLRRGGGLDRFGFVIARWMRYLGGRDEAGRAIAVQDPSADQLLPRVRFGDTDPRPFLSLRSVFGHELSASKPFADSVRRGLESLYGLGAREALRCYATGT